MLSKQTDHRRSVWGDGFAADDWPALSAARSIWDLDDDEYARLFPQLTGLGPKALAPLLDHLAKCVAAIRYSELGSRSPPTSRGASVSDSRFLQDILLRLNEEQIPPRLDDDDRARFAFLSQIHPGYFWAESVITAERDAAAAWLGVLAGGRAAFMTIEVADYFFDTLDARAGSLLLRDPVIASLASDVVDLPDLLLAARERRQGFHRLVIGRKTTPSHQRKVTSFASKAVKRCADLMSPFVGTP